MGPVETVPVGPKHTVENNKVFPADQVCEYDGVLEFCMDDFEYQQFGVALGDADPVVLQRVVSSDDLWEPWGLTLSQFLHALLVHETTQGARHAAAADQLTSDQVEYLLAPLRKMSGPQLFTTQYVGEGTARHRLAEHGHRGLLDGPARGPDRRAAHVRRILARGQVRAGRMVSQRWPHRLTAPAAPRAGRSAPVPQGSDRG